MLCLASNCFLALGSYITENTWSLRYRNKCTHYYYVVVQSVCCFYPLLTKPEFGQQTSIILPEISISWKSHRREQSYFMRSDGQTDKHDKLRVTFQCRLAKAQLSCQVRVAHLFQGCPSVPFSSHATSLHSLCDICKIAKYDFVFCPSVWWLNYLFAVTVYVGHDDNFSWIARCSPSLSVQKHPQTLKQYS